MPKGKVWILSPGRSGTTFLVQLLDACGIDAGLNNERFNVDWDMVNRVRGGLEFVVDWTASDKVIKETIDKAPDVIKATYYAIYVKNAYEKGLMKVKHVFVPVRDLSVVAESRRGEGLSYKGEGVDSTQEEEENAMAVLLGRTIEFCVVNEIPYTTMLFPKFVKNAGYCYDKLTEHFDIDYKKFDKAFKKVANPGMIKYGE